MATVQINQASKANQVTSQRAAQGSLGFPNELQALMSLADIPDPGGGPPRVTAEGGASNPGPNAQSNQPDFLPLLESAGLPPEPIGASPLGSLPAKGTKITSPDPTLIALAGGGIAPIVVSPVESAAAKDAVSSVADGASSVAPAQATSVQTAPQLMATAATGDSAQSPTQAEEMLQVIVDAPSGSRGPLPPPAIQNAIVSAVAAKENASVAGEVPITAAGTAEGQSQSSSGSSGGDQPSNQQTATPDPMGASALSALTAPGQSAPVMSSSSVAGPSLLDSQRLDVVRQVADHIELMAAARPQQGVTIHLQPQGLGDVTIVVKGIGKDIEATFSASNPTVRNALADSRDALTQAVTAKGYNLVGVNIAAHSQSMTGRDRQSSPNQQQSSQTFGNSSSGGGPNFSTNSRGGALPSSVLTSTDTEELAELSSIGVEGVDYRI